MKEIPCPSCGTMRSIGGYTPGDACRSCAAKKRWERDGVKETVLFCSICGKSRNVGRGGRFTASEICRSCSSISRQKRRFEHLNGRFVSRAQFSAWKLGSKRTASRTIEWSLTIADLDELWERQEGKCALTGQLLSFNVNDPFKASLDRIDSGRGYVRGNVQFLASSLNKMKGDLSEPFFVYLCGLVSDRDPLRAMSRTA